jgi:arabinose-5-phosphate isomerase
MVQHGDVVICISKSGNSPEIKVLVPLIKDFGNTLIGMVGNMDSFLASRSDVIINTTVEHEACPNNLAPTASTTAQLAMGDALAVALIACRNFTARDFARFHPGGALGKQLYMRVDDLYRQNERPSVLPTASLRDTILEMTSRRLGCTVVVDPSDTDKVMGIICDGDLRRTLQNSRSEQGALESLTAADIMSANPKSIVASDYAVNALHLMRSNSITQLVVVDEQQHYLGIIHIHDILREGII